MHTPKPYQPRLSSFIDSERASYLLFTAYCKAKEEKKAKTGVIPKEKSKIDANKAYLYFSSKDSNLNMDSLSSSSEDNDNDQDYWEDVALSFQKETQSLWIDVGSSFYAKKKLVKIFAGDFPIS